MTAAHLAGEGMAADDAPVVEVPVRWIPRSWPPSLPPSTTCGPGPRHAGAPTPTASRRGGCPDVGGRARPPCAAIDLGPKRDRGTLPTMPSGRR